MFIPTSLLTFGESLANFERPVLGCIEADFFFSLFFRSGRMTPEKTKRSVNGRKDGDYELPNDRRRNPLGDDDVHRAVVCDYVGPAECA